MACLDEQTVVAFVSGALAGARLAEVERHLLGCADCTTLVALAVPATVVKHTTLEWAGAPPVEGGPSIAEPPSGRTRTTTARDPEDMTPSVDFHNELPHHGGKVGRYQLLTLVGRGGMGEV